MADPQKSEGWHLDKKVPIVLILTLLGQFGYVMTIVGTIKTSGEENTRRIAALEAQRVSERLSSLEAQMLDAKALLVRMDGKMDRLSEKGQKP